MKQPKCHFLGLNDDPSTSLDFPSSGNHCHHTRPIAPVKAAHQVEYCLSSRHIHCPVYKKAGLHHMPISLAAPKGDRQRVRRMAALLFLPILFFGASLLFISNSLTNGRQNISQSGLIPGSGGAIEKSAPTTLDLGLPESSNTPFNPIGNVDIQETERINCPLPSGWERYVVNPTDSLFRLSIMYRVGIEQLQQSNCLEDNVLLPGEVIYVPILPTSTGSATPTVLMNLPAANVAPNDYESQPVRVDPSPPAEVPPPQEVQPTPVPPTQLPSTNTPVPPTEPSDPPKPSPIVNESSDGDPDSNQGDDGKDKGKGNDKENDRDKDKKDNNDKKDNKDKSKDKKDKKDK